MKKFPEQKQGEVLRIQYAEEVNKVYDSLNKFENMEIAPIDGAIAKIKNTDGKFVLEFTVKARTAVVFVNGALATSRVVMTEPVPME